MVSVPTAGKRRARSARTSELVWKVASYGAFAFAFAFTGALVLGLIP